MKLSDAMGAADLVIYAEVALLLFFFAFALVLVKAGFSKESEAAMKAAARLPLEGDQASEAHDERKVS